MKLKQCFSAAFSSGLTRTALGSRFYRVVINALPPPPEKRVVLQKGCIACTWLKRSPVAQQVIYHSTLQHLPLHVLSPSAFQFLICFFKKNYFLVGALAHDPPELARLEVPSWEADGRAVVMNYDTYSWEDISWHHKHKEKGQLMLWGDLWVQHKCYQDCLVLKTILFLVLCCENLSADTVGRLLQTAAGWIAKD